MNNRKYVNNCYHNPCTTGAKEDVEEIFTEQTKRKRLKRFKRKKGTKKKHKPEADAADDGAPPKASPELAALGQHVSNQVAKGEQKSMTYGAQMMRFSRAVDCIEKSLYSGGWICVGTSLKIGI